jgi:hypothetical protein
MPNSPVGNIAGAENAWGGASRAAVLGYLLGSVVKNDHACLGAPRVRQGCGGRQLMLGDDGWRGMEWYMYRALVGWAAGACQTWRLSVPPGHINVKSAAVIT